MQEGFAAGDGDDGCSEASEVVDTTEHLVDRHSVGVIVELVAVGAGEVAAAYGNDVGHIGMAGGGEGGADGAKLTELAGDRLPAAEAGGGAGVYFSGLGFRLR